MKKRNLFLTLALCTSMAGCSNAYTSVSSPNETIMSIGDNVVTKNEIYRTLLVSDGLAGSLELVMNHIMEIEVPLDDDMRKEAQDEIDTYKELLTDDEAWKTFLSYNGYENEEDLFNGILPTVQQAKLIGKYVNERFDVLAVTHKPIKAQIMQFSSEDDAKAALERVNNGEDFSVVASDVSTSSFNGNEAIYTTSSSLDSVLLAAITSSSISRLYETPIAGSDEKYYVLNIVDANPENYKDEAIETISSTTTVQNDAMRFFLQKYDFKISDKIMYDFYKESYPDFIFE